MTREGPSTNIADSRVLIRRVWFGRGLSKCHFQGCNTVDNSNRPRSRKGFCTHRLILRDECCIGTIVSYNGARREKHCNFTRILDEGIEILIRTNIKSLLNWTPTSYSKLSSPSARQVSPNTHATNVERFREMMPAEDDVPNSGLNVYSWQSTEAISEIQTPGPKPILLRQGKLGKGSFGTAIHICDVITGIEYARKNLFAAHPFDLKSWKLEIDVMALIKHQSLEAVGYLHGDTTLQLCIEPVTLSILSLEILVLLEWSQHYYSPEIAATQELSTDKKTTKAVDIWSLWVVILSHKHASDDLGHILSTAMLVIKPASRYSARGCLAEIEELTSSQEGSQSNSDPNSQIAKEANAPSTSMPQETRKGNTRRRLTQDESGYAIFHSIWLENSKVAGSNVSLHWGGGTQASGTMTTGGDLTR
ncbi:hypothetical protein PABG_03516 [Paracoccidioides brasiliensis Pb03]|nr:hypothetical protein PABG_03516 [Paracoccidioides brasiliensis Pb03]